MGTCFTKTKKVLESMKKIINIEKKVVNCIEDISHEINKTEVDKPSEKNNKLNKKK